MEEHKKVLLVNPSWSEVYEDVNLRVAVPLHPVLSLAVLAAPLVKKGHKVKIVDMNLEEHNKEFLITALSEFKPSYAGITFNTSLFDPMKDICDIIKKTDKSITIIGGGPHASSFPKRTLEESQLDIVIVGEGDFVFEKIVSGYSLNKIKGILYKSNGKIIGNPIPEPIKDLDLLPFPAWNLFDIKRYKGSKLISRKNPVGFLETSRGCVFNCCYCNKSIFGRAFKVKSAERVVKEIEYMLKLGFKEIYIVDDNFSTNIDRAIKICNLVIEKKLKFPWTLTTGIRVDNVSQEFFHLLKKAGCYRVAFGIESGNQQILDNIGKRTTLEQNIKAVKMAKKAGLETLGFFMIALPGETEKTMQDTIRFSKKLDLTIAKFSIMIPYPDTDIYNKWKNEGRILSEEWSKYNLYKPSQIYKHPNLDWRTIYKYNKKAYREFYLRPKFIFRRVLYSIRNGMLLEDISNFIRIEW